MDSCQIPLPAHFWILNPSGIQINSRQIQWDFIHKYWFVRCGNNKLHIIKMRFARNKFEWNSKWKFWNINFKSHNIYFCRHKIKTLHCNFICQVMSNNNWWTKISISAVIWYYLTFFSMKNIFDFILYYLTLNAKKLFDMSKNNAACAAYLCIKHKVTRTKVQRLSGYIYFVQISLLLQVWLWETKNQY